MDQVKFVGELIPVAVFAGVSALIVPDKFGNISMLALIVFVPNVLVEANRLKL